MGSSVSSSCTMTAAEQYRAMSRYGHRYGHQSPMSRVPDSILLKMRLSGQEESRRIIAGKYFFVMDDAGFYVVDSAGAGVVESVARGIIRMLDISACDIGDI